MLANYGNKFMIWLKLALSILACLEIGIIYKSPRGPWMRSTCYFFVDQLWVVSSWWKLLPFLDCTSWAQAACKDGPTSHNKYIAAHFKTLVGRSHAEPANEILIGSVEQKESKKKVGSFIDVQQMYNLFSRIAVDNNNLFIMCSCLDFNF